MKRTARNVPDLALPEFEPSKRLEIDEMTLPPLKSPSSQSPVPPLWQSSTRRSSPAFAAYAPSSPASATSVAAAAIKAEQTTATSLPSCDLACIRDADGEIYLFGKRRRGSQSESDSGACIVEPTSGEIGSPLHKRRHYMSLDGESCHMSLMAPAMVPANQSPNISVSSTTISNSVTALETAQPPRMRFANEEAAMCLQHGADPRRYMSRLLSSLSAPTPPVGPGAIIPYVPPWRGLPAEAKGDLSSATAEEMALEDV